jgi:acyl-coenzyme A thioesterase PaaI-like protein
MLHGQLAVTGQLSVTFVKPVPVGRPLRAVARADRREERRWHVSGELLLASTGAVLGRAAAIMVLRDRGHFERHREWLAQQDTVEAPGKPSD